MGLFGSKPTLELQVSGMTCGNCVRHVTDALQAVPGARKVTVDLESGTATITGEPSRDDLVAAVKEAGYEAR